MLVVAAVVVVVVVVVVAVLFATILSIRVVKEKVALFTAGSRQLIWGLQIGLRMKLGQAGAVIVKITFAW